MSLPDKDHFLRYLKPSSFIDNNTYGKGFSLRNGEKGISGHHLETFIGDLNQQIMQAISSSRLKTSKNGVFARINVGETKFKEK